MEEIITQTKEDRPIMITLPELWKDWEVVEEVGQGSYGRVYRAQRCLNGETAYAAIKVIQVPKEEAELGIVLRELSNTESARTYFRGMIDDYMREVLSMNMLRDNENIVSIKAHYIDEKEGGVGWTLFIMMEYLKSLADYQVEHVMGEDEVVRLGIDICRALSACEKVSIIHRDIKPDNIFVDENGAFKLGDFGVSKNLDRSQGTMSIKGSFSYMAPEVYTGAKYDSRADQYSLGMVLYRLMNEGREPFLNPAQKFVNYQDKKEALQKRMDGEIIPPPVQASKKLSRVILKACSYKPSGRYHSAREMMEELEQLDTQAKRLNRKRVRRSFAVVAAAALVIGGWRKYEKLRPRRLSDYHVLRSENMFSDQTYAFYTEKLECGIADQNGKIVLEPDAQYYSIDEGLPGQYIVRTKDDTYGVLNRDGTYLWQPDYQEITTIPSGGSYNVEYDFGSTNECYYYICTETSGMITDKEGTIILRKSATKFLCELSNGMFICCNWSTTQYGVCDRAGKWLFQIDGTCECIEWHDGLYTVGNSSGYQILDHLGNAVTDTVYLKVEWCGTGYYIFVPDEEWGERRTGFINQKGEIVIDPIYSDVRWNGAFLELTETAETDQSLTMGAADLEGNIILEPKYSYLSWDGYGIEVTSDEEYAYFSVEGDMLFPPGSYECIVGTENGYIVRNVNQAYGFLNLEKEPVLPCEYERIYSLYNALLTLKHGKWGITDQNGTAILKPEFDDIRIVDNKIVLVQNDGEEYSYSLAGDFDNEKGRLEQARLLEYRDIQTGELTNLQVYAKYWQVIDKALLNAGEMYSYVGSTRMFTWRDEWESWDMLPLADYKIKKGNIVAIQPYNQYPVFFSTDENVVKVSQDGEWIGVSPGFAVIVMIDPDADNRYQALNVLVT